MAIVGRIYGFALFEIAIGFVIFAFGLIPLFRVRPRPLCLRRSQMKRFFTIFCSFEAVTGLLAIYIKFQSKGQFDDVLSSHILHYDSDDQKREAMDRLQVYLHCCGLEFYRDYPMYIPPSCFSGGDVYLNGCREVLQDVVDEHMVVVFACTFGFACIKIGCMFGIAGTLLVFKGAKILCGYVWHKCQRINVSRYPFMPIWRVPKHPLAKLALSLFRREQPGTKKNQSVQQA
ncbi:unnamed protein product [Calicophoron daubneyi]|uniref:Tetraspanin n=1 Tax=Calicophoron daubneyi TaxID=300641 RepID=A0AAV2TKF6_CALDB